MDSLQVTILDNDVSQVEAAEILLSREQSDHRLDTNIFLATLFLFGGLFILFFVGFFIFSSAAEFISSAGALLLSWIAVLVLLALSARASRSAIGFLSKNFS